MADFTHFFHHKSEREILMSIFSELASLKAAVAAITPAAPVDVSGLATSAEVAALIAAVAALDAKVGAETAPAA